MKEYNANNHIICQVMKKVELGFWGSQYFSEVMV